VSRHASWRIHEGEFLAEQNEISYPDCSLHRIIPGIRPVTSGQKYLDKRDNRSETHDRQRYAAGRNSHFEKKKTEDLSLLSFWHSIARTYVILIVGEPPF